MGVLSRISKTDWIVIIGFWILATPVILSDYIPDMGLYNSFSSLLIDLTLISFISIMTVFYLAPKFLPEQKYISFFVGLLILLLVEAFIYWAYTVMVWGYWMPKSLINYLGEEITNDAQNLGILGGILLAKKYFEGQKALLRLEAETRTSELKLLQSQVNPHFLFNNLNSLDNLIATDPQEARKYVSRLALLYRYFINSGGHDVVTLEEEMDFVSNYIYLLEQRYGASYKFEIIEENSNKRAFLVPPASLQLIIENVVKHNVGNSNNPLVTTIKIESNRVVVRNEKRMKQNAPQSTGTGIKNLKSRFALLSDKEVMVSDMQTYFEIELPFIKLLN